MNLNKPVSAFDVVAFILEKQSHVAPITAWKLQKLIYYCQAWSLVWEEQPLFQEKILAWANGPVVNEIYQAFKGHFHIEDHSIGNSSTLSAQQKETIDHVLKAYGDKTAQWLSDLIHTEDPWIQARIGLKPSERGEVEIKLASMHEYYGSINYKHRLIY